jgi:ribonuclease HII
VFVAGVDENGLGPLLGPLVTTAVTFEIPQYRRALHATWGRELGIDDSKNTAAFGQMRAAEALALAVCEQLQRKPPDSVDELFDALLLDAPESLGPHCTGAARPNVKSTE